MKVLHTIYNELNTFIRMHFVLCIWNILRHHKIIKAHIFMFDYWNIMSELPMNEEINSFAYLGKCHESAMIKQMTR